MAPLDQEMLSDGCGYPRICPTPRHVQMEGKRNFGELLLFLVTILKLGC